MRKQLVSIALLLPAMALADKPHTFSQSKKQLAVIYADNQTSFYCGCEYYKQGKKLKPALAGCGYQPRKMPIVRTGSSGSM